ncbi:hypothetical protein DEO72_LG7g1855 [Vigna unguiculata]|uniref:Uncharacterized protein n=1 Tax=Vigna unguiculata TaxID=3917 RepID=A0A4D6MLB2_VIGUN|nr:hypothetical protein DEO72_LG7g1855 [Vigna unguiculata]
MKPTRVQENNRNNIYDSYVSSKLASHFCPKVKGCPLMFGPRVGPIDKTLSECPNPHFALLQKIQQSSLSFPSQNTLLGASY